MQPYRRRSTALRAKSALVWGSLGFVALQLAFFPCSPWWHPDTEFAAKLNILRQRLNEEPGRPLVIVVGCSRCDMGFQPEILAEAATHDAAPPMFFNFSHLGAGPVMNFLQVRRLLRAGVRPRRVVLEIMPAFVANEDAGVYQYRAEAADLPPLYECCGDWEFLSVFLRRRWPAWYQNRRAWLSHVCPHWADPDESVPLGPLGNYLAVAESVTAERRAQAIAANGELFQRSLHNFQVDACAGRAIRKTAELCRAQGIELTLLLTPEGSEFRSWYTPESVAAVDRFCAELAREYDLRLIDARRWLPDAELLDSHHMLVAGADRFTRRLAAQLRATRMARVEGNAAR